MFLDATEVHKVLPVWRPENEPGVAVGVADLLTPEMPQTDQSKQTVKLINSENGRRQIIDGR